MAAPRVGAGSLPNLPLDHLLSNLVCCFLGVVFFVQVVPDYSPIESVKVKSPFKQHTIIGMDEFIADEG